MNDTPEYFEKAADDDDRAAEIAAIVDQILAAIESTWLDVPLAIQPALETAVLSGIGHGALQVEFSSAGMIASANDVARDFAQARAAELVGMQRDVEGNLVPNPDAQWVIAETTRDKIREIVADAFAQHTAIADIQEAIQQALEAEAAEGGIFSDQRAAMIGRTEVSVAQNSGNYASWIRSGVVQKVRWLTATVDPPCCDECAENEAAGEIEINKPFPSGDFHPPAHPNCRCVTVVSK